MLALLSLAVTWSEDAGTRVAAVWEDTMMPCRILSK
jgi:hypothetical protein